MAVHPNHMGHIKKKKKTGLVPFLRFLILLIWIGTALGGRGREPGRTERGKADFCQLFSF